MIHTPIYKGVVMPGMPRCNKKATKIAYDILGTPANIRSFQKKKKDSKSKEIDKELLFEETSRVR